VSSIKKIRFLRGKIPAGYSITFIQNLYNEEVHRHLRSHEGWVSFYIVEDAKKLLLGQCHFHLDKGVAHSGYKAPFGSLEFSERLELDELYGFMHFIEQELGPLGIRQVIIANPPETYDSFQFARLANALFQLGYRVQRSNLNAHIRVDAPVYESKIDKWELRKVKLAKEHGYEGKRENHDKLEDLYQVISAYWQGLKSTPAYSYGQIQDTLRLFPQRVKLFSLRDAKGHLIAAAIGLLVSEQVMEIILHGSVKTSNNYNPDTLLYEYMYSWCRGEGISMMNLGIAPKNDLPNFKVLRFYHLIGGEFSLKLTFDKELPTP
jgi:hypothetical protein